MAGKPKPAKERRTHPYQIRLTEAEFRALDKRAVKAGVNLSDLIRAAVGLDKHEPFDFDATVCPACGQLMVEGKTIHDACKPYRCRDCGTMSDAPIHTGGDPQTTHMPRK